MAREINYDRLSQVDSNISKYFSKYMASALVAEQKKIAENQAIELQKASNSVSKEQEAAYYASGGFGISPAFEKRNEVRSSSKWFKKNTDDLIKTAQKRWQEDSRITDDIRKLTSAFYVELCRTKNGGRDSKKLAEFAERYVENRLNTLVVEQLARQRVPENSLDYIARHACSGSIVGFLGSLLGYGRKTDTDEKVSAKSEELYDANWIEKGAGIAGSLGLDAMTGGVGIGGKAIGWTAKKVGVSASKAAVTGNVGAVGVDAAFHVNEYSKDSGQYIEEETENVLGDKDGVRKIQQGAQKYRKHQTEFQGQLDSLLNRKIKIRPQEFNDDTKHTSNALLRNHRGNSARVFDNIVGDFKKSGIAINSKAQVPRWMYASTAKHNRAMAASYYAMALEMKDTGTTYVKTKSGQVMNLRQVSQRAYDYAHAAAQQDKPGSMANLNARTRQLSSGVLQSHKGNDSKLINTIWDKFTRQAIPFNDQTTPPRWMLYGKTAQEDRALASKFYALALEMSRTGRTSTKVQGGKVMTLQQVAQRAYDYARAADAVEKLEFDKDKVSASVTQRRFDAKMRKLNDAIKSQQPSRSQDNGGTQSTEGADYSQQGVSDPYKQSSQDQSQQQTAQQAKSLTDGWGSALEDMGLGGFGKNGRDFGYVMAMLPDMLIGMFTGKNPDMKLSDNFLPLASIIGGSFIKRNPMLKLLLMGYGGVSLINNAGKAALTQKERENGPQQKIYKTYQDEPLNTRISSPVMKGRSLVANIDGVPRVLNISEDAALAYKEGKVPLNTLANAVLKKFDESRSLAQHHYESEMTEEQQVQSRLLK